MVFGNRIIAPRVLALLLFAVAAVAPASAKAGFMANYTGFTQMSDSASATDVVNFAVYQNSGGNGGSWQAQLGIVATEGDGNAVDTTAQYVYFYQVVNNGGATSKIGSFNVNSYDLPYTSSGWISHTDFSDGTAVGPAANQYLGPYAGPMPPDDPSNSAPTLSGVAAPGFVADGASVNPLASDPGGLANGDFAQFTFLAPPTFTQSLTTGKYSSVLFLTSNTGPTYSTGQVLNTSNASSSDGGIPTQAPEPATLAMWGLGTLSLAFVIRRRQKNRSLPG